MDQIYLTVLANQEPHGSDAPVQAVGCKYEDARRRVVVVVVVAVIFPILSTHSVPSTVLSTLHSHPDPFSQQAGGFVL